MNIFVYELANDRVPPEPERTSDKFVIEDNVGESIHIHLRNLRFEMSVDDFQTFAENIQSAQEVLDGYR